MSAVINPSQNRDATTDTTLVSAKDTFDNKTNSNSSSWGAGVAITFGSNGMAFGVTGNASAGKGKANETTLTNQNTHVNANNTITINSGNDTNIKGAVVSADTLKANIGGNLSLESLQDTSTYKSSSQSMGGSVTVGYGASGSASYSQANAKSDYKSVNEQSAIKTKDGGFDIKVAGNTDLKGAVIESSDKAITDNKNSLTTATLTTSDIANKAQYSASSISVGISGGGSSMMGMGGYADDKGDASSTTKSAISKSNINITNEDKQKALTGKDAKETIASINTDTKNSHTKLEKIFDKDEVEGKVQASAEIIKTFSSVAPKAIGDYSDKRVNELKTQAGKEEKDSAKQQELLAEAKKWDEGGTYRVALHTAAGGLSGGFAGAASNFTVSASAKELDKLQTKTAESLISSGMNETAAKAIASAVSTGVASGIGAVAGGATNANGGAMTGALSGGTTDMNNRQHTGLEKKVIESKAAKYAKDKGISEQAAEKILTDASCYLIHCEAEYAIGSAKYNEMKASSDRGRFLTNEQNMLLSTGLFTYTTGKLSSLPESLGGKAPDSAIDDAARKMANSQVSKIVVDVGSFNGKTNVGTADVYLGASDTPTTIRITSGNGTSDTTVANAGPTPSGSFTVDPSKSQNMSLLDRIQGANQGSNELSFLNLIRKNTLPIPVLNGGDWGNFRAPLEATNQTNTFGRTQMYLHGGSYDGSIGCIDCGDKYDKWLFQQIRNTNQKIPIEVKYGK